jgi:hypothetical protein
MNLSLSSTYHLALVDEKEGILESLKESSFETHITSLRVQKPAIIVLRHLTKERKTRERIAHSGILDYVKKSMEIHFGG